MRHLAFRFVRHAPSTAGSSFVVDPYLDYRNRLDSKWLEGLKQRKLNVDYNAIQRDFHKWWQAFAKYSVDPSKENKNDLLDNSDGLTNVLKLPNRVIDLQEAGSNQEHEVEVLKSDARSVAEMEEWLTSEVYDYLFSNLPSLVRQSPLYRIRPVFLDACNFSELDYPRVDEGDGTFTSLVGVSLPAQLALIMKSRFSKRNTFPINLLAIGATYKQLNSTTSQHTNASLLSISDQESRSISAFHSASNVIANFLKRLSMDFSIEHTKPEDLSPFASASITFGVGSARIATVSFIGTYVSERLNITIDDANENLKFAHLCHAELLKMSDEIKAAGGDKVEEEVKVSRKRAREDDVPDTESNDNLMKLPQKKFYRQRAHVNPLALNSRGSHYRPLNPESMAWNDHFGPNFQNKPVKNVDVGCGYGGLLFKMSEIYADECSVGMEIREKVSRFVRDKIKALRHNETGKYENISCFRTNAMRYLANFFVKAQLQRMFFLFPDPHFKKKKEKWRIISVPLLSEYAYFINSGGFIYTVTDVLQYHEWVLECFAATKLFEKVDDEELKQDPIFPYIFGVSEEGQKVTRNNGDKYHAIYRRTDVESAFEPDLSKQEDIAGAGEQQEDEENDEDQEDQEDQSEK